MATYKTALGNVIRATGDGHLCIDGHWFEPETIGALCEFMAAQGKLLNPKPWKSAKPGEVWLLTRKGETKPWYMTGSGEFQDCPPSNPIRMPADMFEFGVPLWAESEP